MRSEERVTYMAYPRAAALAEVAWSPPERIDWKDFEKRLDRNSRATPRSASATRARCRWRRVRAVA